MESESAAGQGRGNGEIAVYQEKGGRVRLDVRLEGETVWLSLAQWPTLCSRRVGHSRRSRTSSRLSWPRGTIAKHAPVQTQRDRTASREVHYYNLDAILSVGYRVNSKRGTQFRIWATRRSASMSAGLHAERAPPAGEGHGEIQQAVALLARTLDVTRLVTDEGRAVLDVVSSTRGRGGCYWSMTSTGCQRRQPTPQSDRGPASRSAHRAIEALRQAVAASGTRAGLFGRERGDQLGAILGNVEQTFGGQPLYPSVQARAAHLLYFLIKDHPFSDGNKRIGTLLFLEYLRRNDMLACRTGA